MYKFECENCKKVYNKTELKRLDIDNNYFICENCDYRFLGTDEINTESEADVLNEIERRALKGKATDRELRLLAEGYVAFGVKKIPIKILKQLG